MDETEQKLSMPASRSGLGVGGATILAVFVALCLTTFAVLSLLSARADLNLSRKAADAAAAYYAADSQGQALLGRLAQKAAAAGSADRFLLDAAGESTALDQQGGAVLSWSLPVDETTTLDCTVDFAPALTGGRPSVLRWQAVNNAAAAESGDAQGPQVWQGGQFPQ